MNSAIELITNGSITNQPGAFPIAGPDYSPDDDLERIDNNNDNGIDINEDVENSNPYLVEAEAVLVVSDVFPVPNEIVVDGVIEKSIDFRNPRIQALTVTLFLIFVAFIVAIGLLSNQKQPLLLKIQCGNGPISAAGNVSLCSVVANASKMPSIRSNLETSSPSDVPTLTLSHQPTTSPTRKGWTLLYSGDISKNIPLRDFCFKKDLSSDGLHILVDCYAAQSRRNDFHVMELTPKDGWVSVFNAEREIFDHPSSISYDGTTVVFYSFGVVRVLKSNNGNSSEWRQHVIENSEYRWKNEDQFVSLSGDGNRLAILQATTPNKTNVMIYDCENEKNETWIQTGVIDGGSKDTFDVKISSDGWTIALSETIIGDYPCVNLQVMKYNVSISSWQRKKGDLKITHWDSSINLSDDGNSIVVDTSPTVTKIFQYNASLSKYELNMEVDESSLPSLSGSGTRLAVASMEKREVRVYDILGNRLIQAIERIDPCDEVKSCDIEYLSLSRNGSKLTIGKMDYHEKTAVYGSLLPFVNTYEIEV